MGCECIPHLLLKASECQALVVELSALKIKKYALYKICFWVSKGTGQGRVQGLLRPAQSVAFHKGRDRQYQRVRFFVPGWEVQLAAAAGHYVCLGVSG